MLALVRRRFLLVLLTAVAVAVLAYLLAVLRPVTFTASSVLIVPSGAGGSGPGQANEALRLATTYAELIPRDGDVLLEVASTLQVPIATARDNLTVTPLGGTALLQVSYGASDSDQAVLASNTAAEAVVRGEATSDTVPRGSVQLVSLATDQRVVATGGVTRYTLPIGYLIGLALGAILAVAAERADRRVDNVDQLGAVLDVPVLDLETAPLARREALVRRWRDDGPEGAGVLVGVAGADMAYQDVVATCYRLADGMPPDRVLVAEHGWEQLHDLAPGDVLLVPAGAPGSGEPHEEVTTHAHVVALVVPLSAHRTVVSRSVSDLLTYGSREPGFALLTKSAPPRSQREQRRAESVRTHQEQQHDRAAPASPALGSRRVT